MLPDHISYYQIPAGMLAKLYSNSMFALLNSRSGFKSSADIASKPRMPTGTSITVLQFVETHIDPEVAVTKVLVPLRKMC
jgi:hypothetical protein